MSKPNSFDLSVIGSGPGGYVAAIRAAQSGMKVAIVERENLGGICLNWGCIPTKALLKSAEVVETIRKAHQFGIKASNPEVDFNAVIKRSRQIANRLSKGVGFLMKKNNIEVFEGTGQLEGNNRVVVLDANGNETAVIHSQQFLLATGARPRNLPGLELDGNKLIAYREAMTLPQQPKSMIIIGAGAIGVEFAYFYNAIGTQVTLLEMMPQILPLEDTEIVETVHKSLKKSGIRIHVDTRVTKVDQSGEGVTVYGTTPDGDKSWDAELCLVAVGIQPNSDGIGLEETGIETDQGYVKVDDQYRTNVGNVWAIGDLIGVPMLAHAASHEGLSAVEAMIGLPTHRINPDTVPSCTYCQPQVASVGITEAQAKGRGLDIKIGRFPFVASSKAVAAGEREGLVKLIFDGMGDKLLGAHIVGPEATELIAESGLAQLHPEPFKAITSMIHAHPTLSEAVIEAALDATGRAIHL
jgi:dihydrolipoamide dehydrogenase